MNASLGPLSGVAEELVQNTPSPAPLDATQPAGNAGGVKASKFSEKIELHGVAVGVGIGVGLGLGVAVGIGVGLAVGLGVGGGPARKAFRTDSVMLIAGPPLPK